MNALRSPSPSVSPSVGPSTGHDWSAWHLHLSTPAPSAADRVITRVIAPVARQAGRPWFFLRYWQGGPHVRFRMAGLSDAGAADLQERLAHGLADHGAPAGGEPLVDAAAYREQAERQASGETGVNRQVTRLRPAGVWQESYAPEFERYGGRALMAQNEEVFQLSSELTVRLLEAGLTRQGRARAALALTAAAASAVGDQAGRSLYFEIGRRRWADWAASFGYPAALVSRAQAVSPSTMPAPGAGPAWTRPWTAALRALGERVDQEGTEVAPAVISSQVHMSHNRLGLGILDELRTYAVLAAAEPLPAGFALPPLP
jgi:thiopeptide-type bacteriocin biosynthesis protein